MTCLKQMVDIYEERECGVIGVQQVSEDEVQSYGVIDGVPIDDRLWRINALVEKPAIDQAPSNIAIVGRYILDASIFKHLEQTDKGKGGEIQLTDAIARQLKDQAVMAYQFTGKRYDCGDKLGYLQANVELGLKHEQLSEQFKAYLKSLVADGGIG